MGAEDLLTLDALLTVSYALTLAQHTVSSQRPGLKSYHCPQALQTVESMREYLLEAELELV